jgi:non-ribosomal peptide synthase protein (TIGR01720 family)
MAELVRLERVGLDDSFFALGGDSIMSMQLVSRARQAGVLLTVRQVFEDQTPERMARTAESFARSATDNHQALEADALVHVRDHFERGTELDPQKVRELVEELQQLRQQQRSVADQSGGVGPIPLTPIMHWLQETGAPLERFSQSVLVQVPAGMRRVHLTAAIQAVLDHHEALRLQVITSTTGWVLQVRPRGAVRAAACVRRVGEVRGSEVNWAAHRRRAARQAAGRLAPANGVMLQAVWFDAGSERPGQLLLVGHHLAVDGVSWRILVPDLQAAWTAVAVGGPVTLPATGTSFRRWAELLVREAQRVERVQELAYWQGIGAGVAPLVPDPLDPRRDTIGTARHWAMTLPVRVTEALLTWVPAAFHGGVNDVLLAALLVAVERWRRAQGAPGGGLLLELEGHGREEIFDGVDLSRTVGWLTSAYPVRLELPDGDLDEAWRGGPALGQIVKTVKEQLRHLPDHGLGYGLLRYLNATTAAQLRDGARTAPLGFNYLGRFTVTASAASEWALVPQPVALGGDADEQMPLPHVIAVNAVTRDGPEGPQLHATWRWAPALVTDDAVRLLAHTWGQALERLVQYTATPGSGGLTPSDIPLMSLTQAEIDQIEKSL